VLLKIFGNNLANTPDVEVAYKKNDSKINTIIQTMKKPLIVIGLSFILFHPYTSKLLAKLFPKIFNNTTFIAYNLRILCLSLILGLSFLFVTSIMKIKYYIKMLNYII
jgi:hypothetical protein